MIERKAPIGKFRLVCESPMDCEVYMPEDFVDFSMAKKAADDFAGAPKQFLNAFVYDDIGREVYHIDGGY